jgi:hypothetical protein
MMSNGPNFNLEVPAQLIYKLHGNLGYVPSGKVAIPWDTLQRLSNTILARMQPLVSLWWFIPLLGA